MKLKIEKEILQMNTQKVLLNENKKAMQFLHEACGFDFQKEFFLARGEGRFTYNGVKKIVSENVSGSYVSVLLVMPNKTYRENNFHYVSMEKGKFNPTRHDNLSYWNYDIDCFFGIGDFEDTRKNKTDHYYIVAQKTDLIQPKKPEANIELSQRFRYIPQPHEKAGDGKGKVWMGNIKLMLLNGSAKQFEYKPFLTRYANDKLTDNVNEIIDKSGYLTIERHRELNGKAHSLRANRAKTAAMLVDYTERETAIYEAIEEAKKRLANQTLEATTCEDSDTIHKKVYTLRWILFDMGLHAKYRQNKKYRNIAEIENRLSNVENKLKEI